MIEITPHDSLKTTARERSGNGKLRNDNQCDTAARVGTGVTRIDVRPRTRTAHDGSRYAERDALEVSQCCSPHWNWCGKNELARQLVQRFRKRVGAELDQPLMCPEGIQRTAGRITQFFFRAASDRLSLANDLP